MRALRHVLPLFLVLAAALPALAHGGTYRGGNSGGPGGPPPGPSDEPSPITQWETWWANNKYLHLRLGDGMRERQGATTPDGSGGKPGSAEDPVEVRLAQDRLVREAVVPVFLEALNDPSFEVRTAAAIALGKTGDPSGVEPLRRAAQKDEHGDVRDSALLGLGLLGQVRAIPWLDEVLRDEQAATRHRSFAAFSLGLIGGEDAATCLVGYMRVPAGLRHRGDGPLLASCFLAMGFTGQDSVLPTLREACADSGFDDQVRAIVWLALGRMRDRESMKMMVSSLGSPRQPVCLQRAAAVSLGRIAKAADAPAVAALLAAMRKDSDPLIRHFAATSLGTIANAATCAELRKEFESSDGPDRAFLALALGVARDESSAPALRKALAAERNESLRGALSIALGMIPDRGARAVLETQVKDRGSIWPQGYAALALGMARIHEAAPVLRTELEATNDPRLRANLAIGLGLLQDPAARKWFLKTLRTKGTIYERGGAAMALGLLRVNEAIPSLVEVWRNTKDEMDLVRAYSIVALGILCDPSDPPKLARFTIDQDYSIRNDPLNEVMTIF